MSFLSKVKSVFSSNKGPIYKNYTPAELKVVAMKTRIVLEEYGKKSFTKIKECDSQLMYYKTDAKVSYKIFKEIGQNVIEI